MSLTIEGTRKQLARIGIEVAYHKNPDGNILISDWCRVCYLRVEHHDVHKGSVEKSAHANDCWLAKAIRAPRRKMRP